jgi:Protein of unknown function (DUF1236)
MDSQEELTMTRLLMSGVAVAALVAFGSMADAQQQQQPTYQTQPSQGGGASTDTSGGGAGGGAANQVQEEQPGTTTKQKSSEDTTTTKKKSSGSMQKQTEQTKSGDKTKKTQAGEESSGATGATGKAGKIDVPEGKRSQVAKSFSSHKVKASNVDVDVSIGIAVPRTVVLHPVPADVIAVVPAFRHYKYFVLANGEIVIVDPATFVVVYVLTV